MFLDGIYLDDCRNLIYLIGTQQLMKRCRNVLSAAIVAASVFGAHQPPSSLPTRTED